MQYEEYRDFLRLLRSKAEPIQGFRWGKAHLRPLIDPFGDRIGWQLTALVGVFLSDKHFVRFKEHWKETSQGQFERGFFSYHYGPYEDQWILETVRAKKVIVRVDASDYEGRGYHIHDGGKQRRIFQEDLVSPDLSKMAIDGFFDSVVKIRRGQNVEKAYKLKFR